MFQVNADKMRRLNIRTPLNHSSDRDVVTVDSFNYSDHDYFIVSCNATTDICINGTMFGDNRLPFMDYYYDDDHVGWDFFDIYYSTTRFAVETTMALLSMTLNVLDSGGDRNCHDKSTFSSWSQTKLVTKPTLPLSTVSKT